MRAVGGLWRAFLLAGVGMRAVRHAGRWRASLRDGGDRPLATSGRC